MNRDKLKAGMIGAGIATSVIAVALIVGMIFLPHGRPPINPPTPGPATQGDHVVILVDDTSPSIPQALVIDGPDLRACKAAGQCSVVSITEPFFDQKNYDDLLRDAGGAPAMAILTKDGGKAFCGRLPTDTRALKSTLAKHLRNLPPPLAKAQAMPVVARENAFELVDGGMVVNGEVRKLGTVSSPAKFGALPSYSAHNPVFPIAEWYDLDRRNIFGSPDWILDQNGISSCVGNGWAGALRRCRALAGMKDVKLSPGFTYALINGGLDEGAVISDGIAALKRWGTCPFDVIGQKPFYYKQISIEAHKAALDYKLVDAFRCDTWEETVSALLTGRYTIVYGYMAGSKSMKFDQFGAAGHDPGMGNHCVAADGVKKLPDGRWVLDMYNSWSPAFGPWKNGRVYHDKQTLFGGGCRPDVCAIRIAGRSSKEAFDPPAYKPALSLAY